MKHFEVIIARSILFEATTILEGRANACDPQAALKVAVAIIKANEAMAKGVKLEISPSLYAV